MSAHEFSTRLSQEFSKRADLAMYRAGIDTVRNSVADRPVKRHEFFFSESDIQDRVGLLKRYLPGQVDQVVRTADNICRHQFDLLGYEGLDYGAKIDWHLDAVHGKRAPRQPWYTISFLDFSAVGDHKVTWELNRHQHLVTLAKAWCITKDDRYTSEIFAQWYDWHHENPYPIGINWGSSLEVAFRSVSWLWVKALLAGCRSTPAEFEGDLLRALARNGRYIESFLSTYFSPNTHLIGEAFGLFSIGMLCPEIRLAPRWLRDGRRILLEEAERQVRADGVYFEQALHYHVYALDFFLHARTLAEKNRMELPADFNAVLERMLDVLAALSQVGSPQGFGDDDGGRLFDARRNRSEHMTDALALGALGYGREDLLRVAPLTEESIWLFGERAAELSTARRHEVNVCSAAFPAGGIYALADPQDSALMVIDAGPQGTGRCGHGHADALSIRFSSGGRHWLIDPGTGCYISDDGVRGQFRSTAAHNTLRVDRQDQAVTEGPFAWSSIPRTTTEKWVSGNSFDFFSGSHDGYERIHQGGMHRRFVFHPHGGPWLIRDLVGGREVQEIEAGWHFAQDLSVAEIENGFVASENNPDSRGVPKRAALLWICSSSARGLIEEGAVAPCYGKTERAQVARVRFQSPGPAELASVIVGLGEGEQAGSFRVEDGNRQQATCYRYKTGSTVHLFHFSESPEWSSGPWASDAAFLYCCVSDGRLSHLVALDGSSVKYQGKTLVKNEGRVERFEWVKQEGGSVTYCSQEGLVVPALDQEAEFDSVSSDPSW